MKEKLSNKELELLKEWADDAKSMIRHHKERYKSHKADKIYSENLEWHKYKDVNIKFSISMMKYNKEELRDYKLKYKIFKDYLERK